MIWVIAGTVTARNLIGHLAKADYRLTVSTATVDGGEYLGDHTTVRVISVPMDRETMIDLIGKTPVDLVVDASHPYAVEVSENAMDAARETGIPYIRLERPPLTVEGTIEVADYDAACDYLLGRQGNILVTTGSKHISRYDRIDRSRLYVRTLPVESSIIACRDAKIKPDHIIAMQGVFSKAFNYALMREYTIKYMVTKESGKDGGVPQKIDAAVEAGVEVLVIKRPKLEYPTVFYDINDVLDYIKRWKNG